MKNIGETLRMDDKYTLDYIIAYEYNDRDLMLLGDVPWE
jgi:AUX/IAA family